MQRFIIKAEWDDEAQVWYVAESDVPGLATEAPSVDALIRKLRVMVPEMLELNGVIPGAIPDVPFDLMAHIDGPRCHR